ncbi:hypothetical protein HAX54_032527 [Datura stramonium]|uniref:Uncharacterized protein n=1 Tax=Datura stramonium TaxID=4076 RepID=A0ABS8VDA2_DATST|nr:hypothetical protein [Datura stramonium]
MVDILVRVDLLRGLLLSVHLLKNLIGPMKREKSVFEGSFNQLTTSILQSRQPARVGDQKGELATCSNYIKHLKSLVDVLWTKAMEGENAELQFTALMNSISDKPLLLVIEMIRVVSWPGSLERLQAAVIAIFDKLIAWLN